MKKKLRKAHEQAEQYWEAAEEAETRARGLAMEVELLKRQVEDMRKNWRPVPITHPWQPRDARCALCDDTRDAPRHQEQAWAKPSN